ncbi:SPOR domain-containing protein [Jannaschia sp. W003]|nr:SPOR domain-containing protein [Jannaschia sp. W003]
MAGAVLARGIVRSARPRSRPAALRDVVVAADPVAAPAAQPGVQVASASATRDIEPVASVAPGTRVVQLGAFDSESIARSEWERMTGRHGDYLADYAPMIQKAQSGGRDFWRLRVVGFDDAAEARRLCTALLAQQQACIPVTVR